MFEEKSGRHMGSKQELKWFFLVVAIVIFFIALEERIQGIKWLLCAGAASFLVSCFLEKREEQEGRENLLFRIPAGISFLAYVIALTIAFALNR